MNASDESCSQFLIAPVAFGSLTLFNCIFGAVGNCLWIIYVFKSYVNRKKEGSHIELTSSRVNCPLRVSTQLLSVSSASVDICSILFENIRYAYLFFHGSDWPLLKIDTYSQLVIRLRCVLWDSSLWHLAVLCFERFFIVTFPNSTYNSEPYTTRPCIVAIIVIYLMNILSSLAFPSAESFPNYTLFIIVAMLRSLWGFVTPCLLIIISSIRLFVFLKRRVEDRANTFGNRAPSQTDAVLSEGVFAAKTMLFSGVLCFTFMSAAVVNYHFNLNYCCYAYVPRMCTVADYRHYGLMTCYWTSVTLKPWLFILISPTIRGHIVQIFCTFTRRQRKNSSSP